MGYWKTHTYKRRSVEEHVTEFAGWNKIIDLVKKAKEKGDRRNDQNGDRDASLVSLLFIGGFRVGEAVKEVLKKDGGIEAISGLRRENIQIVKETEPNHILFQNVMVLKGHRKIAGSEYIGDDGKKHYQTKRVPLYRIFPVPIDEPLVDIFLDYIQPMKSGHFLFPITPTRAYQIIQDIDPEVWPHWFRAQRASQLAREYGWDLHSLMEFFHWKDMKTSLRYASMGYGGLLAKLPKTKVARVW